MKKPQMQDNGFTLVELILVITVILILAGISLPNYYKAKERAIDKEAIAGLKLILAAEKIYRMEYGSYYPASGSVDNIADINTNLKLFLPVSNIRNWDYAVGTAAASARRNGGSRIWLIYYAGEQPGCIASCL